MKPHPEAGLLEEGRLKRGACTRPPYHLRNMRLQLTKLGCSEAVIY